MKQCKSCGDQKPLSEFYKDKGAKDGHKGKCKVCHMSYINARYEANAEKNKAYQKKRRKQIFEEQGGFIVYYLPEHNYIGMTNNLIRRLGDHRKSGKFTEGHEVVGRYKTAAEAHLVETTLHCMGYQGYDYKGNRND
tara:strand:+ start:39 stop:449 length:411 start_codon:yes stop_codon:yes gene_type:complete